MFSAYDVNTRIEHYLWCKIYDLADMLIIWSGWKMGRVFFRQLLDHNIRRSIERFGRNFHRRGCWVANINNEINKLI